MNRVVLLFVSVVLLFSCASEPTANNRPNNTIPQSQSTTIADTASNNLLPQNTYFMGSGGKGTSLAVLKLRTETLPANEQWLSSFVQGVLTNNFSKFTAMTVVDRQYMDDIIQNQIDSASGYFSDNDFISIGNLTNAEYILVGTLQRIQQINSYLLDLSLVNSETGERKASFPPTTCSFTDLQNTSIIQTAFENIIAQLDIILTESGRSAIYNINQSSIAAESSLSKGIVAQENGRVPEALTYYYESVSFNPQATEATNRLSGLSTFVSSGNIVESVRYDFQQREAWANLLKECEDFFSNHLPYEIIYNPTLTQRSANYEKKTVELQFRLSVEPTSAFKVIQDILSGLKKTGKKADWGFFYWPLSSPVFADYRIQTVPNQSNINTYTFDPVRYTISAPGPALFFSDYLAFTDLAKRITIISELVDHSGKVLSTARFAIHNSITFSFVGYGNGLSDYDFNSIETLPFTGGIYFQDVNVDDLTDDVFIRISSINGIDVETAIANGYVKVSVTDNVIRHPRYRFKD